MDTNKKHAPSPIIQPLPFKKKSPSLSHQKKNRLSLPPPNNLKNQHSLPTKK